MDDDKPPKKLDVEQIESQEQKRSRIYKYLRTTKNVGSFLVEKLPVGKIIDAASFGKKVHKAVEQEDIAAKTENREPRPFKEILKETAKEFAVEFIKDQLDSIVTPMGRDEDAYTLNDRGDVPYYVKAQQKEQKDKEEYWKRRINDYTEAAKRSKQASDYEAGIENYYRNEDPLKKMSSVGHNPYWREKENKLFDSAEKTAHLFKQNEYQGTVAEKYQYLLHLKIKDAVKGSLDRVYYPERGREIDKEIFETLFVNGYEGHKILEAIYEKSPFAIGLNDVVPKDNSLSFYRDYIRQNTYIGKGRDLWQERDVLEAWRLEQDISVDDRRSRKEIEEIKLERTEEFLIAFNTLKKNPETRPSTLQEFQMEAARRYLKKEAHELLSKREEEDIALRLLVTRNHSPESVAEAIQKGGLSGVGNPEAGNTIVHHLQHELKTNPSHQHLQQLVDEVKHLQGLEHETRLDRLGLDTPLSGTKEYTVDQRPKDKGLDYEFDR